MAKMSDESELNTVVLRHIYFYILSQETTALRSSSVVNDRDINKKIREFIMNSVQKEIDSKE